MIINCITERGILLWLQDFEWLERRRFREDRGKLISKHAFPSRSSPMVVEVPCPATTFTPSLLNCTPVDLANR